MFSIITIIFIVIISTVLRNSNSTYRHQNEYMDIDIAGSISNAIKKFFVMRKHSPYIMKRNHIYHVRNNNTAIEYNSYTKQLKCMDKTDKNKNIIINWLDYEEYHLYSDSYLKNLMDNYFYNLCDAFNSSTSFRGVVLYYANYKFKKPTLKVKKPKQPQYFYVGDYFSEENGPKKLIDINSASLKEISGLPGINIVLAKRIIKYREEHNGFKSLDELYNEFKIKPHFRKQLDDLIMVFHANNPEININLYPQYSDINNKEQNNNDRIIDI